ncbi:four helix bundle protein [Pontibacter sp. BT310]|uniref:Four helix bundle protein n=1 Tax=Pontibacter populi TaxID=890055 RepID=A0ABS6X7A2_9BACT|nr:MULTISPECIES: four helix bundle protein [Pontibacter]MBJ6117006.1 four helix bundle protein [Pontibacter sp. BT310]MBR0569430.1 four helix bundle protein [Microvirga sp. STS03]MBW3363859.1 four helix bundle protein [Pontibacter populi]
MKENVIVAKSYAFAIRIVKLYEHLKGEKQEYVLAKQLLRSGTSVGANVEEAVAGQSTIDFIHKLSIARKEARESSYWLRLLHDTAYIKQNHFESIHADCEEIIKILNSIIITSKAKLDKKSNS